MTKPVAIALLLVLAVGSSLNAQDQGPVKPQFTGGVQFGYNSGAGLAFSGMISEFARGFPLGAKLGLWYSSVEAGSAWDARQIFINNATNGSPEKKGQNWELKLDFLYPVKLLSALQTQMFGGGRHSSFTGNFKFVGGNEDFDVTSSQWGVGGGLESHFGMSRRVDLLLTAGVDYYFGGMLYGHDTAYNPNNENVNPREDFTYSDADAAIGRPTLKPLVMLGFGYRF
jgi:hypothetical protein